jgi:hypothetical protein
MYIYIFFFLRNYSSPCCSLLGNSHFSNAQGDFLNSLELLSCGLCGWHWHKKFLLIGSLGRMARGQVHESLAMEFCLSIFLNSTSVKKDGSWPEDQPPHISRTLHLAYYREYPMWLYLVLCETLFPKYWNVRIWGLELRIFVPFFKEFLIGDISVRELFPVSLVWQTYRNFDTKAGGYRDWDNPELHVKILSQNYRYKSVAEHRFSMHKPLILSPTTQHNTYRAGGLGHGRERQRQKGEGQGREKRGKGKKRE